MGEFGRSFGGLTLDEFERLVREQEAIRSGISEQIVAIKQRKAIAAETVEKLQKPISTRADVSNRLSVLTPAQLEDFAKGLEENSIKMSDITTLDALENVLARLSAGKVRRRQLPGLEPGNLRFILTNLLLSEGGDQRKLEIANALEQVDIKINEGGKFNNVELRNIFGKIQTPANRKQIRDDVATETRKTLEQVLRLFPSLRDNIERFIDKDLITFDDEESVAENQEIQFQSFDLINAQDEDEQPALARQLADDLGEKTKKKKPPRVGIDFDEIRRREKEKREGKRIKVAPFPDGGVGFTIPIQDFPQPQVQQAAFDPDVQGEQVQFLGEEEELVPLTPESFFRVDPLTGTGHKFPKIPSRDTPGLILNVRGTGGHTFRRPYTLGPNGEFGNITVDMPSFLSRNLLIVMDLNGNIIMKKRVDNTLIRLLTTRYSARVPYTIDAQRTFRKMFQLSGLPFNKRSKKSLLLRPTKRRTTGKGSHLNVTGSASTLTNNPDKIFERFMLLMANADIGNDQPQVVNEIIILLDKMLNLGTIDQEGHNRLFNLIAGDRI